MDAGLAATLRDPRFPPAIYGPAPAPRPALDGSLSADVCVVGGGYTGLSAALHLARAGRRVVVIDAWRIGHGASGRNGGQLLGGQRQDQVTLERMVGPDHAQRLWHLGQDAVRLVRDLVAEGDIPCDLQMGAVEAGFTDAEVAELHHYRDHLARNYGHEETEALDRDGIRAIVNSPRYAGGLLDRSSGQLNPFAYALGLARMAEAEGAELFEATEARAITPGRVWTDRGEILAEHVIVGCNGYLGRLLPQVAARVLPINTYVLATEPLPPGAALGRRVCVADTKFVVNYFRTDADNRLIFGGGESYGHRFPADIAAKVRKPMAHIFPDLKDVRVVDAWGGTVAITRPRFPHFALVKPGLWTASGYSGHGIATATQAGKLISLAIQGDSEGFDTMAGVHVPSFPGGSRLRAPLLTLAMTWFALRDRLGI
ncbi:FAD-dependent oxidoreductase [Rhodobacterales bacterium HKCCE2091]|nr:FAD-dependent oxidoreductase [Rhodobacterales bacterium HKCCE2091]